MAQLHETKIFENIVLKQKPTKKYQAENITQLQRQQFPKTTLKN